MLREFVVTRDARVRDVLSNEQVAFNPSGTGLTALPSQALTWSGPVQGFQVQAAPDVPDPQSAATPIYDILNSAGATAAEMNALTTILTAAWGAWAAVLGTDLAPRIRLEVIDQTFSGRAQGGAVSNVTISVDAAGLIIGEPVFNQELRTGVNSNGTANDILIQCDIDYLRDVLFFDTTLGTANDIPANRTDAYSVFVHEIGHGLGYNGYGPGNNSVYRSTYDYRSDYTGQTSYFSGPNVQALLGGPLPLTTGNTAHYGNPNGPGADLIAGYLMNGVVFTNGYRYEIGSLDLAVLEDIGMATVRGAIYDQTWLPVIDGGGGIDTFRADYSSRTVATNITVNSTSFTAPSTLPTGQSQTVTLRNIEQLDVVMGSGNDTLVGGAYDDKLNGGAGNDILIGGGGNNTLIGGDGYDIAVFAGARSGYASVSSSAVVGGPGEGIDPITGISGGRDTLSGIEALAFVDGQLTFHRDGMAAQVMRLYDSAFNRIPDAGGFEAQLDAMEGGMSLNALAQLFVESIEFQNTYGALADRAFVEQLYRNVLDREGDSGGITNALNSLSTQGGTLSRGQLLVAFSESVEHMNLTQGTLDQGLWIADEQTLIIARLYDAAWNRLPDEGGLITWRNALGGGTSLQAIADAFAGAAEFTNTYGALNTRQFVEQLYRNVLNREGDAAGIQNAVNAIELGGQSRGQVMLAFSESAEHIAVTRDLWIGGVSLYGSVSASIGAKDAGEPLTLPGADEFVPLDAVNDDALVLPGVDDALVWAKEADEALVLPGLDDGAVFVTPSSPDHFAFDHRLDLLDDAFIALRNEGWMH